MSVSLQTERSTFVESSYTNRGAVTSNLPGPLPLQASKNDLREAKIKVLNEEIQNAIASKEKWTWGVFLGGVIASALITVCLAVMLAASNVITILAVCAIPIITVIILSKICSELDRSKQNYKNLSTVFKNENQFNWMLSIVRDALYAKLGVKVNELAVYDHLIEIIKQDGIKDLPQIEFFYTYPTY